MEENRIGPGGARGLARRGFLARAAGIVAVPFALVDAAGPAGAQPRRAGAPHAAAPQDSWLGRLGGKHGQIFDTPALRGGQPLQQVRNYLDAWRDAYGVPHGEIDAVVGVHGTAVPMLFQDPLWEKYALGKRSEVLDPRTGAPALRNVFAADPAGAVAPDATVAALRERGAIFLLCNNSLKRLVGTLAGEGAGSAEAVRAELVAGLIAGVEVVPAMVVAVGLAQEKGLSYAYLG